MEEEFDKLYNGDEEKEFLTGENKYEQFKKEDRKNTKGKDPQDPFGTDETRDPFEINPILTEFQIDSLECTRKHKERERDFKEKEKMKKQKI